MEELTPTQRKVYYIVKDYIDQKGYSPTFREVARLNGNNSVATAKFHLDALKRKGYITFKEKLSRTLTILR